MRVVSFSKVNMGEFLIQKISEIVSGFLDSREEKFTYEELITCPHCLENIKGINIRN